MAAATIVVADLGDPSSYQFIVDEAVAHYGTVDVLVNNAIVVDQHPRHDARALREVLAVNLTPRSSSARPSSRSWPSGGVRHHIMSIAAMRGRGRAGPRTCVEGGYVGAHGRCGDAFGSQGVRINACAGHHRYTHASGGDTPVVSTPAGRPLKTSLNFEGDAWVLSRAALFLAGAARYITGCFSRSTVVPLARSH